MSDRRRQRKEQRTAKREAERKREQRRELSRRLITAFAFGLLVVAIFAAGGLFGGDDTSTSSSYDQFRSQATACGGEMPPPVEIMSFDAAETQSDISATSDVTATVTTSCGEVVIQLDPANYPETVNSFVFLAREGFYDGQVFHRIVADFVIQGGDPEADGTGGPGYLVADEFPEDEDFTYVEGTVAMANRGAQSTGSQFFIVVGDDARHLTPLFSVLGEVISGNDVLADITSVEVGVARGSVEESLPRETVYIESISIEVGES